MARDAMREADQAATIKKLPAKIGELTMERVFFKSVGEMSRGERLALLDRDDPLSLGHQCKLMGVSRRATYRPTARTVSEAGLDLMRRMDTMHMESPAMGARHFVAQLRLQGVAAGCNRVRWFMLFMGIRHVAPSPKTSVAALKSKVYPYLLRKVKVSAPNQVWCADITYIPVRGGFMYLVAIMDWATRFVLSRRLSNSMWAGGQFLSGLLQRRTAPYGRTSRMAYEGTPTLPVRVA